MKDVREAFTSWYVIDGEEHLKMGSFSDAIALMAARWDENNESKQLIMMSDKEYAIWDRRKTKRGKNS